MSLRIALCFFAMLLTLSVRGQRLTPSPSAPVIPETLDSPRATVRTFLEGMNDTNISQAVSALDLSEVGPLERAERGPQLAFQLWAILNRQTYIQTEQLSDDPDAKAFVLPITDSRRQEVGRFVVAKSTDGAFRVSSETLRSLPRIWSVVRDKPVVAGLPDPSQDRFDPAGWFDSQLPSSARDTWFGIPIWRFVVVGLVAITALAIALALRFATHFVATKVFRYSKRDDGYQGIRRAGLAVVVVAISSLLRRDAWFLGLSEGVASALAFGARIGQILGALLFAFAVWDGTVDLYVRRMGDRSEDAKGLVAPLISRLGKAVMVVFAALAVLTWMGVNVTGFIATLGIGGLAIALAAKDSVENVFGSVVVLLERPFKIGDWIRVGEIDGVVEEIHLRSTRIRTFDDSVIVLPNSTLVTSSLENFGMRRYRRLNTMLCVVDAPSTEALERFTAGVRDMLAERTFVWSEKRFVYLNDFGATSRNILLNCYLDVADASEELTRREEILLEVSRLAEAAGLRFAVPTTPLPRL